MIELEIKIEIDYTPGSEPSKYRLYFDQELLSERQCNWDCSDFTLTESIYVSAEHGDHKITIDRISGNAHIFARRVVINGKESPGASLEFKL